MKKPSSPIPTRWFESIDLMKAEISLAHWVIVVVVHVPVLVLGLKTVNVEAERCCNPDEQSSPSAPAAPRLVRKFPPKDRRFALVTTYERLDVGLERGL